MTAILLSHHNKCHDDLLNTINKNIEDAFNNIILEYQDHVPELQSKLDHTKNQIAKLQQEIENKCTKNRKRGL